MKIRFLNFPFALIAITHCVYAQKPCAFFSPGGKEWIESSQCKTIGDFFDWAKTDTLRSIVITGWVDKTGTLDIWKENSR